MKFEYKNNKYTDLGLVVKHGNTQNIVLFWDENENAAGYILALFRLVNAYESDRYTNGFINKTKLDVDRNGVEYLTEGDVGVVDGKLAVMRTYERGNRREVLKFDFSAIKPVKTCIVDRNTFYHSFGDLPCGDYIICLQIENRQGDTIAESTPYYFHVYDAEEVTNKRLGRLIDAQYACI